MTLARPAAREGDPVCHRLAILGAMLGGALGLVGAFYARKLPVIGRRLGTLAIGAGIALGSRLVESVQRWLGIPDPRTGDLLSGAASVTINGRGAVRSAVDGASCNGLIWLHHFPRPEPILVATGVSTVTVEGYFGVRVSNKLVCGATVKAGSPNVVFGGLREEVLEVAPTREDIILEFGYMLIDSNLRALAMAVVELAPFAPKCIRELVVWGEVFDPPSPEDRRARVTGDLAALYPTDAELNAKIDAIIHGTDACVEGQPSIAELTERSIEKGFYGSDRHMEFAQRVYEDTGGRISLEQAMAMQPFGGDTGPYTGWVTRGILAEHSITHDVGGFLLKSLDVGAGYGGVNPSSELNGQVEGLLALALGFGH